MKMRKCRTVTPRQPGIRSRHLVHILLLNVSGERGAGVCACLTLRVSKESPEIAANLGIWRPPARMAVGFGDRGPTGAALPYLRRPELGKVVSKSAGSLCPSLGQ